MNSKLIGAIFGLVLAAALVHTCLHSSQAPIPAHVHQAYATWRLQHGKLTASPTEQDFRLRTFYQNMLFVQSSNDNHSHRSELNQFADLTEEEFKGALGLKSTTATGISGMAQQDPKSTANLQQQVVTARENKAYIGFPYINGSAMCNDNYAWTAAAILSGTMTMEYGVASTTYLMSPQRFLDCPNLYNTQGCDGGLVKNILDGAIKSNIGMTYLSSYPYTGVQVGCKEIKSTYAMSYIKNNSYSATQIINRIKAGYTLATAMDITSARFYSSGIFSGPCTVDVNQNMILTGFGVDDDGKTLFWSLMNTWGSKWGVNGTIKVRRFTDEGLPQYSSCGITTDAYTVSARFNLTN